MAEIDIYDNDLYQNRAEYSRFYAYVSDEERKLLGFIDEIGKDSGVFKNPNNKWYVYVRIKPEDVDAEEDERTPNLFRLEAVRAQSDKQNRVRQKSRQTTQGQIETREQPTVPPIQKPRPKFQDQLYAEI